jgi:hypothetical protein
VAGVRVYPNEKVRRVVAAIPPGHKHVRLVIELEDQTIVLQEAAAAAIARAYVDVVTRALPAGRKREGRRGSARRDRRAALSARELSATESKKR